MVVRWWMTGPVVAAAMTLAAPVFHVPASAAQTTETTTAAKNTKKTAKESAKVAKDTRKATNEADKAAAKTPGNPPPPDATAQCKDGTYTNAHLKRGACSDHGGVGTWLAQPSDTTAKKKK